MPINDIKVRDARPQINANATSEKGLFKGDVAKGFVELRRGSTKGSLLRIKYGEVSELRTLLQEIEDDVLSKNQYDTKESLKNGYDAGPTGKQTGTTAGTPTTADAEQASAQTPSESGVVSIATQGTAQPNVEQKEELAREDTQLTGTAADGTDAQPQNDAPAADPNNPFA